MELEKGINRARQLANLTGKKDTEFYNNVVYWLEELREFRAYAEQGKVFHGMTDTRLYHIWKQMKSRCYNAASENYKYYGGRGIKICDEWNDKHGFMNFYNWAIRNGYEEDLTIDRIDVDGNYSPNNCRWVTALVQAKNKRGSSYMQLTYKNKTMSIKDWAEHTGLKVATIRNRLRKGWSVERTLETPLSQNKSHEMAGKQNKKRF